jgi:preprotein translocase subunit SecB
MDKKYSDFIGSIELVDIYLASAQYKRLTFPDPENYPKFTADFHPGKVTSKFKKEFLEINQEIKFLMEEVSEDQEETRKIFELKAKYSLLYRTTIDADDDLLEMFKQRNVPINLHPFARELIQSAMAKTGLSPFTLPVLKIKK